MTNRDRLLTTNEYDQLMRINEYLLRHAGQRRICVLDALTGQPWLGVRGRCSTNCGACLQAWLNAKEDAPYDQARAERVPHAER